MSDLFHLDPDGIYRCRAFDEFVWQKHGFGTRIANPEGVVSLKQIHSDIVRNAESLEDRACEGDALITNEIGKAIGVRTADCVPLLILDSKARAVAAVHAGWRGTVAGIASRAVEKMANDFGCRPADLYVAIGPCIRVCCYEVGEEVARQFTRIFTEWAIIEGKRKVDLPDANRWQLEQLGLGADRIFDSGLCTSCDLQHFFSYRREPGIPDRMTSAICRVG